MNDAAQQATERRLIEECRQLLSHELRSPLMVIDGFAQQLLEQCGPALGERGERHLSRMRGAARHMQEQVEGMLVLVEAVRRPFEPDRLDLADVFAHAAAQAKAAAPGRQVAVEIEPSLVCEADEWLVARLARALVDNAWKFTALVEGARVRVAREGHGFVVEDNGVGFEPAYAARLFQVFGRLHAGREFQGHGYGLALARHVVDRHGGRIEADSAPGQGCRVRFSLSPA